MSLKKKKKWQNESVEQSGRDGMEGTQMRVTGEMAMMPTWGWVMQNRDALPGS